MNLMEGKGKGERSEGVHLGMEIPGSLEDYVCLPGARPGQFLPNVFNPVNGELAFSAPDCGNVPLVL